MSCSSPSWRLQQSVSVSSAVGQPLAMLYSGSSILKPQVAYKVRWTAGLLACEGALCGALSACNILLQERHLSVITPCLVSPRNPFRLRRPSLCIACSALPVVASWASSHSPQAMHSA